MLQGRGIYATACAWPGTPLALAAKLEIGKDMNNEIRGAEERGRARARREKRGRGTQEEKESARHGRRGPETEERARQGGTGDR